MQMLVVASAAAFFLFGSMKLAGYVCSMSSPEIPALLLLAE